MSAEKVATNQLTLNHFTLEWTSDFPTAIRPIGPSCLVIAMWRWKNCCFSFLSHEKLGLSRLETLAIVDHQAPPNASSELWDALDLSQSETAMNMWSYWEQRWDYQRTMKLIPVLWFSPQLLFQTDLRWHEINSTKNLSHWQSDEGQMRVMEP